MEAINTEGLAKYYAGFWHKRFETENRLWPFVGFLDPNGTDKSTVIKILRNLIRPT